MARGDRVLDRLALRPLEGDEHWRTFSTLHPASATLAAQAVCPNPRAKGRFARIGGHVGMFYVGSTEATAVWETVLVHASIDADGLVYVHPAHLANQAVAHLSCVSPATIACLDVRTPHRYLVVEQNSPLDQQWMRWLTVIPAYDSTHEAAENAHLQLSADGQTLVGIVYPSRRFNAHYAAVLYIEPRTDVPWAVVGDPVRLDTAAGTALLANALRADGFTLIGDPAADPASRPTPGAL